MTPGKRCVICGKTAKETGLYRLNSLDNTCGICRPPISRKEISAAYKARHPERVREAQERYSRSDRGRELSRRNQRVAAGLGKYRARRILAVYGITDDEWNALFESQHRCCAFCGTDKPGVWHGKFVTDHDHVTGVVRGILCDRCNRRLGFFGDDLKKIERTVRAIRRYLTDTAAISQRVLARHRKTTTGSVRDEHGESAYSPADSRHQLGLSL